MSKQSENDQGSSTRFSQDVSRRDVLGLAARWAAFVTGVVAVLGMLHLPISRVFPEKSSRFKIGKPSRYAPGSVRFISERRAFVFASESGFYTISAVCTHLGCVVQRADKTGEFLCACHGTLFSPDGELVSGPAPKGLLWLKMSLSPEGDLVIDERKTVPPGTRFVV